jgi:hypothetical protein
MKTAVKDATLSDTEAIYLASVILGVCDLNTEHVCISAQRFLHLRNSQ